MDALNRERENLENAASKLISAALKAGADAAEVCGAYSSGTKITLEKQDFHLASSDDGYNLGIRVQKGQRQGFASCNSIEAQELKETAAQAIEIAKFSPENPHISILTSENLPKEAPSADLWDDGLFELSLQTQKDWTKLMNDECLKDTRFKLNEGSVDISSQLFLVQNSRGTHKLQRETAASWSVMGMAVDGDNITSFDYFSELSRRAQGVPDRVRASTKKFRDEIIGNLKSGASASYKGLVVFSPRAVGEVILPAIAFHLNGRNIVEGISRWKLDQIGSRCLPTEFTIKDSPWLMDRFGCSVFDREGTPTQNNTLIQSGNLNAFLFDHYAAKALGTKSTGNAVGGPSTTPSVSAHCMNLAGGAESAAALLHRVTSTQKDFLMVHRFSGQVDPITGDFSGVAKGAEWWHAGERAYYVKETLISGNLFEILEKDLFGVSKETEVVDCQTESPTVVLSNVSVTSSAK